MIDYSPGKSVINDLRRRIQEKAEQLASLPAQAGLLPLKIACVMSSCRHGRHCLDHLRRPRPGEARTDPGQCRDCHAHIIDLPECGERRYNDESEILATCLDQQSELIRAHYWHVPVDLWAYNQALRLGRRGLRRKVIERVTEALTCMDAFAGRRAGYNRDIVAYAQHAVAGCCRRCASYWHGLPSDGAPSRAQLDHVIAAALIYIDVRLPGLPDDPQPRSSVGVVTQAMWPDERQAANLDEQLAARLAAGADPTGLLRPINSMLQLHASRGADGGYLTVGRTDYP